MGCTRPDHAGVPQDGCTGCARECEAELTRLGDQQARSITDRRGWEERTTAAARRAAQDHMRTWAGLYYLQPALTDLTFPLEETLGRAANVDPAWGRTKDQRALLETLKVRAGQAQQQLQEVAAGAEPAWQADPREAEITRLRQVITDHAQALHKQYAPPSDGFTACTCPGCELIRAMDTEVTCTHAGSACGGYKCPNCRRASDTPFSCPCGAGRADHVLIIPDAVEAVTEDA
jgi:hypothetical protein